MKISSVLNLFLPSILVIMTTLVISKLLLPGNLGNLYSYVKDLILIILLFVLFILFLKKNTISKDRIALLSLLYLFICLYYTVTSPLGLIAFKGFIQMVYGPLLFFIIRNIKVSNTVLYKISKFTLVLFSFTSLIGLIIFFIIGQDNFYSLVNIKNYYIKEGMNVNNLLGLYRFSRDAVKTPRLSGLLISPTEVTCIAAFLISLSFALLKRKVWLYFNVIIGLLVMYFSASRSIVIGFIMSIALCKILFQKKSIIFLFAVIFSTTVILLIMFVVSNLEILSNYIDPSSVVHLNDLLIRGPAYAIENYKGIGVGMSGLLAAQISTDKINFEKIHIESEYLMMIIQIGVWGFIVYFYMIVSLVKKMVAVASNKDITDILKSLAIANISIISTLHIGALTFPILVSRILVTFMWVFSALIINNYTREKNCLSNKKVEIVQPYY